MKLFKTAVNNAKTHDIIYSLCIAAPAAIAQAKKFNLPEVIGLTGGNLQNDATLTGQWIRQNVKYKIDTFENQNIQLPSSLLNKGTGDCKSISLLFLSIMEAAGYNGGFRFAGYKGKNFTHVYNFFVNQNKIYTFDACISNLQEVKRHTILKDMRVNYLAGVPTMINEEIMISQPTAAELMQDDRVLSINGIGRKRKPFRPFKKFKNFVDKVLPGGGTKPLKTFGLAPARGSFILLVNLNFRALAKRLNQLKQKNATKYAEFWTKLGGDVDKLNKAVAKGLPKKPVFGKPKGVNGVDFEYLGEPVTAAGVTLALGSAAGIISSLKKLLSSLGINKEPGEGDIDEDIDPETPLDPEAEPGEPVIPNDPASNTAAEYIEKGIKFIEGITNKPPKLIPKGRPSKPQTGADKNEATTTDKTPFSFTPSPLMLGVGAAAVLGIYLLTKKKK
jgi:hypothetical protein